MGKGYRRRQSNLNLHKYSNNLCLYKKFIVDYSKTHKFANNEKVFPEEFVNLKNYIISKFMDPLINKKYGLIKENFFNFDYVQQKLTDFDEPTLSSEIDLLNKIVLVMKHAVEARFTIDAVNKKMHGDKSNLFLVETSKIVLKAKYEIYTLIFGDPKITNGDFKQSILSKIQTYLDKSPGCTVEYIRTKLKDSGDI
jgi:hypothetical protein